MVVTVGDKHQTGGVDGHSGGCGKPCRCVRAILEAGAAGTSQREHQAGTDLPDDMIVTVRDEYIAAGIEGDTAGAGELRRVRKAVDQSCSATARQSGQRPAGNFTDAVIAAVRDQQGGAGSIDRHTRGKEKLSIRRHRSIRVACQTGTSERAHHLIRGNFADTLIQHIGDVQVASRIDRDIHRLIKLRTATDAVGKASQTRARVITHHAFRSDFEDLVCIAVRNIHDT